MSLHSPGLYYKLPFLYTYGQMDDRVEKGWNKTPSSGSQCMLKSAQTGGYELTCIFKACELQRGYVGPDTESFGLRWIEVGASNANN